MYVPLLIIKNVCELSTLTYYTTISYYIVELLIEVSVQFYRRGRSGKRLKVLSSGF
jgi:hypothetical protein